MDTLLSSMISSARSIKSIPFPDLPRIENVVSTVNLLPLHGGYRLPLEALSMRIQCSQYAPVLFAANIIKLTDSITDSTALIFASGKIVVVASLSVNHTRYISQLIRMLIEQVQCMMIGADGHVYEGSLLNRTIFEHCRIHNIVGSGDLHCKINLQAMCDAAPMACKWFPDLFPGLKCKIWLTPSHACECSGGGGGGSASEMLDEALQNILGKQSKCSCAVKMLIFKTGRIVITGARTVQDINNVFFRIKKLAGQFNAAGAGAADSSFSKIDGTFYKSLSSMLVPVTVKEKSAAGKGGVENLEHVMQSMQKSVKRAKKKGLEPTALKAVGSRLQRGADPSALWAEGSAAQSGAEPPALWAGGSAAGDSAASLLKLCLAGRINDVRLLLQLDNARQLVNRDAHGYTLYERMTSLAEIHRPKNYPQIMELLKLYQ